MSLFLKIFLENIIDTSFVQGYHSGGSSYYLKVKNSVFYRLLLTDIFIFFIS